MSKVGHQRFIAAGIPALQAASQFLHELEKYINETGDPSLLAMTGNQAQAVLQFMMKHQMYNRTIIHAMTERKRISELQGGHSLSQKRRLAQERQGISAVT